MHPVILAFCSAVPALITPTLITPLPALRRLLFLNSYRAPPCTMLQRNHICLDHKRAECFAKLGAVVRFCQRCGVSHPLGDFEGLKRSCRKQLERHNERR